MGKPTGDCVPVQLSEDIWTQSATHGPGNSKGPIKVLNRSIVYRLRPQGADPFLVVLNGLWCCDDTGEPIRGLEKLEEDTGASVKFVLTPGSGHHLSLHNYAAAFPEARVCVPDGRIPRQNPELMALGNVETYTADTVPAELSAGGLEIAVWEGLLEGPMAKKFQRMQFNFGYELGDIQPQCFLHRPTGTITNGGHHMWYRAPEGEPVFTMPGIMKFMIKLMVGQSFDYIVPGKLSADPNGSYAIGDREKVQASARAILDWEFDRMIDVHAGLDSHLESGARSIFEDALSPIANGEWDKVPFPTARA